MDEYEYEFLEESEQEKIANNGFEKYIKIIYEKKYFWFPSSWYGYDDLRLD